MKLRVGIIGCGKMGMHHVHAIKELKRAALVGIADPRQDADEVKKAAGADVTIFCSAEEMLANAVPDAVHVVTPPGTHYNIAKMALEAGSHVFVEKPFTLSEEEARDLVNIAEMRNLRLYAGHQLLAHEATRNADTYVKYIGDVVHVESYFSFRKVRKSITAADQAIDILPHPVYTMLHYLGAGYKKDKDIVVKALEAETDGEIRTIIDCGGRKGILVVTLKGRPVDSYLKIVGTYGTVYVDYVRGVAINLSGSGADAIAAILMPYRLAWQSVWRSTKSLAGMALRKNRNYAGLVELIDDFYGYILNEAEPLVKTASIIETVAVCEKIALELREKERAQDEHDRLRLDLKHRAIPPGNIKGRVLVTGGSGFLGRAICKELSGDGWQIVSAARTVPGFSEREPGIEYQAVDLAEGISGNILENVSAVIHCAAETSGGKIDHERNSVLATRRLLEDMAAAGVDRLIHISSLAVLKPGSWSGGILDETTPIDSDNMGRGAYVWGKSKAEEIVSDLSVRLGINARIIRPGPLVDFAKFEAPGRLGREIAPYYIVMGSKKSRLSVCDVRTAAKVVCYYLKHYDAVPRVLNLVEPGAMTRQDLIVRLLAQRKDLTALFMPDVFIRGISAVLYAAQKIINPSGKPLSIAAAFSSETYNTDLAETIVAKAISS